MAGESGASGITLPALFKRANTGSGTFYHYFKDKDELLAALFEQCIEVEEELVRLDDPTLPTKVRFRKLLDRTIQASREHPREMEFIHWFVTRTNPDGTNPQCISPAIKLLCQIIEKGQQEALLKRGTSALALSFVVMGMVYSMHWSAKRGACDLSDRAVVKDFTEGAWRGIA